jgi:DNA modification methylase
MSEGKLSIEYVGTDTLILCESNPRKNDVAVESMVQSFKAFGWTNPILVRRDNNTVIAGHTRLKAARAEGLAVVPVVYLDLNEVDAKAYMLADNKMVENVEWDFPKLADLFVELDGLNVDLSLTGFTPEEIEDIAPATFGGEGLTDDDAVPEAAEAITKTGDLWLLGEHRLLCGDSTKAEDVERLMDGEKASICFTSPPYNVGCMEVAGNKGTGKKYRSSDDNKTDSDYYDFLKSNIDCMFAHANELFYNIGLVQGNKKTIFRIINHYADRFKDIIYWKKNSAAPHIQAGVINNLIEFIICFGDGRRKFCKPQFKQGTYWNVIEGASASHNEYADIHKATFPVYLPKNIIDNFTDDNSIVVDCFLGSGTTLIACEKTSHQCYGMEIDPHYCDVIVKRWEDYTGKKAELAA